MTTADGAAEQLRPGRRWGRVVSAVAVVALVGAVLWWWRHPSTSFEEGSYGIKKRQGVGESVWTTLVHQGVAGAEEVTFTDLEPVFDTDGAEVTVDYVVCVLDPDALESAGVGSFGYGLSDRSLERLCQRTRPAEGATYRLRADPPQVLLAGVTPTRSGRTRIERHRVSFRVGWQSATNLIEVEEIIVARRGQG